MRNAATGGVSHEASLHCLVSAHLAGRRDRPGRGRVRSPPSFTVGTNRPPDDLRSGVRLDARGDSELLLEPATTSTHVDVADTIDIGTDASADGDSISADDPVDEIGDVAGGTNIEDSGLLDGTEQMGDPTLSIR